MNDTRRGFFRQFSPKNALAFFFQMKDASSDVLAGLADECLASPEEAGLELGQRAPSPLLSLLQNPNPADAAGPLADPVEHLSAQEGGGTIPG